jgi:hypothetical protein
MYTVYLAVYYSYVYCIYCIYGIRRMDCIYIGGNVKYGGFYAPKLQALRWVHHIVDALVGSLNASRSSMCRTMINHQYFPSFKQEAFNVLPKTSIHPTQTRNDHHSKL